MLSRTHANPGLWIAFSPRLLTAAWLFCGALAAAKATTHEVAQGDPKATDDGPGTAERPWKTLARAASGVGAGDTVLIRDGVYRESVIVKASGRTDAPIRFVSAPGAHVVVTGAERLSGWQKTERQDSVFQAHWPHKFNTWSRTMAHPGDEYHRLIGRCEQVVVDGYLLRQVLEKGQLAPGTFFADVTNQLLFVWDHASRDLNKVFVEASVRQELLRVEGSYVSVRGVHFRYAANAAQHGAVVLMGEHGLLEDCTIEAMNASGATFAGSAQVVRRCVFTDNGQLGFGANGAHQLLFTECLVENNNTKGFDRGWEAGGNKLVLTRDAVLERSRFIRNRGHGLWFDIGNENCTVRQCNIADNEDSGVFYEISFGLHAQDNVITGNGFAQTAGAWGAQAGISISSSPGCVIERNLIVANREGLNFREQTRTTPRISSKGEVAIWNHDETIQHNVIAFNRDAQIWGWFDVNDNRHWREPLNSGATTRSPDTLTKPGDIADRFAPTDNQNQPQGLNLEKLRLRFVDNIYFADPGQKWFEWGVTWGRHKSFATLSDFQTELGIDRDSRALDPGFADMLGRDYRVKSDKMKQLKQNYPQGQVPESVLGLLQ